jgi:hypothetical protein
METYFVALGKSFRKATVMGANNIVNIGVGKGFNRKNLSSEGILQDVRLLT